MDANGTEHNALHEFANAASQAGFSVIPAVRNASQKRPDLPMWAEFQDRRSTREEIDWWFRTPRTAVALVCGSVSGNLEMIDFDCRGEAFDGWKAIVEQDEPGLVDQLVVESTPSGGKHVVYRCHEAVEGNQRLARRRVRATSDQPVDVGGKSCVPRRDPETGEWFAEAVLIETRGEGGLFLCAPSPEYEVTHGELLIPPTLTPEQREILLCAARQLDESPLPVVCSPSSTSKATQRPLRPGDDFNRRGDVRALLKAHDWSLVRDGENSCWRRPGKATGTSATLKDGVFYVFSSNAAPFEPSQGYSPFAVYSILVHGGDWSAAACALRLEGYGEGAERGSTSALHASLLRSEPSGSQLVVLTAGQLMSAHSTPRSVVVSNLIRRGETMNIIAPPKTGKSWLVNDLAISVATGRPWLDTFETTAGRVLIMDNELHPETIATRLPMVADARGIDRGLLDTSISVVTTRGNLQNIHSIGSLFEGIGPGVFDLVVLDSMYRFLPDGVDENSNSGLAGVYNQIDKYAELLQCAFVLVHHTTKGSQAERSVTDVGAGAGAQSRAADTHLVFRDHQEEGVVVLEAVTRSFESVAPICVRPGVPAWNIVQGLDPTQLRQGSNRSKGCQSRAKQGSNASKGSRAVTPDMSPEQFASRFVESEPRSRGDIRERAKAAGVTWRDTGSLLNRSVEEGLVQCTSNGKSHKQLFTRVDRSCAKEGVT